MKASTAIGFIAMMIWGGLCGMPALAVYNLVMRARTTWVTWAALAGAMIIWFPLVTVVCLWAVFQLIGLDFT